MARVDAPSITPLTAALQPGVPFLIVKDGLHGPNLPQNHQKLAKNSSASFYVTIMLCIKYSTLLK